MVNRVDDIYIPQMRELLARPSTDRRLMRWLRDHMETADWQALLAYLETEYTNRRDEQLTFVIPDEADVTDPGSWDDPVEE